ncbi:response regulator transcription factor [Paenibacillus chungangensis]|uniref:Response regulator n=1 Tax=Paenibacillus chungangensis TaxID=696535 RepID=A0ABW3HVR4_9BACL
MYSILIVDDEPLIRMGLRQLIERCPLDLDIVGEAANGNEAIELLHQTKPHIMVTDIRMPVLDGLDVIKHIKTEQIMTKIIILSGYSDYAFLKKAIEYGVESYLLKPIDDEELLFNLQSIIQSLEKQVYEQIRFREGLEALRTNTLNRLVHHTISLEEYKEKSEFLGLDQTLCSTALLEIASEHFDDYSEKEKQLLLYAVSNICNEILAAEGYGLAFVNPIGHVVLLMNRHFADQPDHIRQHVLATNQKKILDYLNKETLLYRGTEVQGVHQLHQSYKLAQREMHSKLLPAQAVQAATSKSAECLNAYPKPLRDVLLYIDEHYSESLTLKGLAEAVQMNASYLGQIFKQETGTPFTEYVNRYRVEKATRLLQNTSMKVYEVSEAVGFTDYSYFLKIFKKHMHANPSSIK